MWRSPRHRDRHRHTTDPPKTRPGRPDQRIHVCRLTPGRPAGHLPNRIFERDKVAEAARCEPGDTTAPAAQCQGHFPVSPAGENKHMLLKKKCCSGHHHWMPAPLFANKPTHSPYGHSLAPGMPQKIRSEERRVGKECR